MKKPAEQYVLPAFNFLTIYICILFSLKSNTWLAVLNGSLNPYRPEYSLALIKK